MGASMPDRPRRKFEREHQPNEHMERAAAHHAHHGAGAGERAAAHVHGDHGGHDKHAGHSVAMFRNKFWVCLALTIPALIWEPMLQQWFGYTAPAFPGSRFIPALFGTL